MKKKVYSSRDIYCRARKFFFVMKLTILALFLGMMGLSAATYSQKTKLSLDLENVSIRDVFKSIESQSEFVFIYENDALRLDKKVSITVNGEIVDKILSEVLKDTGINFDISDKQIVITKSVANSDLKSLAPLKSKIGIELQQPRKKEISGKVKDSSGLPLPGATVMIKGTTIGTITDSEGQYQLSVPEDNKILVFTFIGMKMKEVPILDKSLVNITLEENVIGVEEVVVVGYGQQKKESVVGSIVQVKSDELQRTGGVTNVGQALTGLMAGVSAVQISGAPGAENPLITIRGAATWNNTQPLILVDGVERSMNEVDVSDVASISVLKDASATAVFGVKGAEGVILITTKRGSEGAAKISFSSDFSSKSLSRMPNRMSSYDALMYQNLGIERELPSNGLGWSKYEPINFVNRYNPQYQIGHPDWSYIYPDVNWLNEITDDSALSQRYNISASGGSKFAKYFVALSYTHDGDILRSSKGLEGESADYGYKRYTFRANLDFNLTSSTLFSFNLAGAYGMRNRSQISDPAQIFRAFYETPSGLYPIKYPDGTWGYYANSTDSRVTNAVRILSTSGLKHNGNTQYNTDFILKQKLDFFLKGLSAQANFSYDTEMFTLSTIGTSSDALSKFIDPKTLQTTYSTIKDVKGGRYDYIVDPSAITSENATGSLYRSLNYEFRLNYGQKFGKHDVTALAMVKREEQAKGNTFPNLRESWVGRVTYNYNDRYLLESNGAYNGSEKFSRKYRFGFFPSLAAGWLISNEAFLKDYRWLDKLKVRYSLGLAGDDGTPPRWQYETQWKADSPATAFADATSYSGALFKTAKYSQYIESLVGNPDLQWELAKKQNIGIEASFLNGMFGVNLDLFREDRDKVFLSASQRLAMSMFGAQPPPANVGKTQNKGYELELKFQHTTPYKLHYWLNYNLTYSRNKIIAMEDAPLLPDYQKKAGKMIGQQYQIPYAGFMPTWDDVYSTPYDPLSSYLETLPGDYARVDYNGDGLISSNLDSAPYGYPVAPLNTYGILSGIDYKGFSFSVQFYGVYNATSSYGFTRGVGVSFFPIIFDAYHDYWTPENQNTRYPAPRAVTSYSSDNVFDISYLRLKNIDLAYTFQGNFLKKLLIQSLQLSVGGNNLLFWSDYPEDREDKKGIWDETSSYPLTRRLNLGLNVTF